MRMRRVLDRTLFLQFYDRLCVTFYTEVIMTNPKDINVTGLTMTHIDHTLCGLCVLYERKPSQPWLVFMQVLYPGQIGIWSVGFCGGRKSRKPQEKSSGQGKNRQQTKPTYGTRLDSNPGHIAGRQALSLLRHPHSPVL